MIAWIIAASIASITAQSAREPIAISTAPDRAPRFATLLDVRDLVLQSARTWVMPPEPGETPEAKSSRAATECAAELERALRTFVRPALDPELDQIDVTADGKLVANLSADRRAWLDAFLALQRSTTCVIDAQLRFVQGPRHAFDRYGLADAGSALLDAAQAKQLITDFPPRENDTVKSSWPRLVMFNRGRASMSIFDTVEYIERWDVRLVEPGRQVLADPVVAKVDDGYAIDVRPVLLERSVIGAVVQLKQTQVKRPIATRTIRLATPDNREVEIASPEITTLTLDATLVLEDGVTALFLAPMQDDDHDVAVLLSMRRVDSLPDESDHDGQHVDGSADRR